MTRRLETVSCLLALLAPAALAVTTGDLEMNHEDQGALAVEDGWVEFDVPARSATTLFSRESGT